MPLPIAEACDFFVSLGVKQLHPVVGFRYPCSNRAPSTALKVRTRKKTFCSNVGFVSAFLISDVIVPSSPSQLVFVSVFVSAFPCCCPWCSKEKGLRFSNCSGLFSMQQPAVPCRSRKAEPPTPKEIQRKLMQQEPIWRVRQDIVYLKTCIP
jgi:hypothetical protein